MIYFSVIMYYKKDETQTTFDAHSDQLWRGI